MRQLFFLEYVDEWDCLKKNYKSRMKRIRTIKFTEEPIGYFYLDKIRKSEYSILRIYDYQI